MHSTSRARSVWVALLHRYYLTGFPRPFLLPKPLEHCTSSELEALITGWFKDVRDFSNEFSPPRTSILPSFQQKRNLSIIGHIPGSRFMLHSARNGSIYYQDLQNYTGTPPTLLIESPFHSTVTESPVRVRLSFEPLLPLGPGFQSHEALEDQWFPRSLNLVVIWDEFGTSYPTVHETVIEVWTLSAQIVGGELTEYFSERSPMACLDVATTAIALLNWAGLTKGSFPCERVNFQVLSAKYLVFLPQGYIMQVHDHAVNIWKLSQGTRSTPFQEAKICPSSDFIIFRRFTPFFVRESIRIVMPTIGGLSGEAGSRGISTL
ncbi:hypothetical protein FA15DRAFT_710723 [Coprinopsis marcescibilis]|uniref:Uncharacterized protein n=1 Tax=Coprinopsis marcescibilis TaxID=230819 RepID=A0A5C3KCD4_COPMA|nr:hypothetical protein FA15DRAFT_710723 [Coprinopsis marcescibilis]